MSEHPAAPVSRRQLRLAEEPAHHPVTLLLPTHGPRSAHHATHRRTPRSRPAPAVSASLMVLVVTLVSGGVSQAHAERVAQDLALTSALDQQQRLAASSAIAAELARRERSTHATTLRMSAQGEAYAAGRRNEALTLARSVIETAGAVAVRVAPVVSPEALTPLDQAITALSALIETTPAAQAAAPVGALQSAADLPPGSLVTDAELDAAAALTPPVPAPGSSGIEKPAAGAPAPAPAPVVLVSSAAPASATVGVREVAEDAPEERTSASQAKVAPPADVPEATGDLLDLELTAQLLATADQVTALSAEVQAVADANIAAADEAARIAEEEAAAARRAAAELARKVSVAEDSDNGRIPEKALCGVSFDKVALLRCDAAAALEDLNRAFRKHFGVNLDLSGAYRSLAAQVATKQTRGGLAAAPGTSNHGRGLAVDFSGFGEVGQYDLGTYRWMKANAEDFGWYHPDYMEPGGAGPAEPWHWEFGSL
jgi:LAS superfamily LD-carboxypeptidase LdcB